MKNKIRLRKLGRTGAHRTALFRNMVTSLIKYERIKTTLPKAKALRHFADRVVTWAKRGLSAPCEVVRRRWRCISLHGRIHICCNRLSFDVQASAIIDRKH